MTSAKNELLRIVGGIALNDLSNHSLVFCPQSYRPFFEEPQTVLIKKQSNLYSSFRDHKLFRGRKKVGDFFLKEPIG